MWFTNEVPLENKTFDIANTSGYILFYLEMYFPTTSANPDPI